METTKTRYSLGIDIGTTTISAALLDIDTGRLQESCTLKSEAAIPSEYSWDKRQDAGKIEATFFALITSLLEQYPDIVSIGFTGQMHGILYLDADGNAVSPLYTWQDERAGQGSPSTCEKILQRTGYTVPAGYGLATHLALAQAGEVPEAAACLCTIMDALAMKLCGLKRPVMHTSNAASLGFFPVGGKDFDRAAVEKAGIDPVLLPEVTMENRILGLCGKIPVSVAIGDNQASFLGAVREPEHTALANFGTGSQISVMVSHPAAVPADLEVRPWLEDTCLMSGSALCGGRAYALLERFFREYAVACGLPDEERYDVLNRLAAAGMHDPLEVSTTFGGTRADPDKRGNISGIGLGNFTPSALAAGVLKGMAQELYQMYQSIEKTDIRILAASGNAVRRNPVLVKLLEQVFGMPVMIPEEQEEAALGAAIFSAVSADIASREELAFRCIRYTEQ